MLFILFVPFIFCVVWLFQMMKDLADNSLPTIMMKCFGIMIYLFILMMLVGKQYISLNY